jgi:hypothetical protein
MAVPSPVLGEVRSGENMGFFGGKKDKNKAVVPEQQAPKKSRRIVAPGGKPAATEAPPASQPASNKTAVIKPSPSRPALPAKPPGPSPRPNTPAPVETVEAELISAPPRPKGKDPIMVGSSRPPEFTGGLGQAARRTAGPCRTGDAALLDFLRNKANLLDDDQVSQVRSKAETDGLPIDVAAVQLGIITEDQMVNALTQECWVPHLKVDKYEIRKKALDTIAREDATHYGVFPVDKLGSLLTLAMVNPLDAETIRVLETKTGLDIKKVVATRSEITQGIEKYYSGQVQAKDTSIAFTQDVEPKSVTQMMSKVSPSVPPPAPPSRPMPAVSAPPPLADNIVPEIQDIDDLLSSDEAIAPAIIEPISLKAEAEVVPLEPLTMDAIEPEFAPAEPQFAPPPRPAAAPAARNKDSSGDFEIGDLPATANDPTLTRKHAPAQPPLLAPEFELDDAPVARNAPPARPTAPAAPVAPAAPAAPTSQPPRPATATPARPAPPVARPATSSITREAPKQATSRFTGTARAERTGIINLIPVTEEEFQHAITHGKSHVFEKWVGLQSRNRIINAVSIEAEFDTLLAGLYAGAKAV